MQDHAYETLFMGDTKIRQSRLERSKMWKPMETDSKATGPPSVIRNDGEVSQTEIVLI